MYYTTSNKIFFYDNTIYSTVIKTMVPTFMEYYYNDNEIFHQNKKLIEINDWKNIVN